MGPPPTAHFHILADTPSGLQPINPPKAAQPSAARTMFDVNGKRKETKEGTEIKKEAGIGTDFGLKMDQYDKKNAALKREAAATATR